MKVSAVLVALMLPLVFTSCFLWPNYVQSFVEANAVWSESDDEIAIIRSVYETTNPLVPFYADESARNWTNVVYLADGTLGNRREVYRWADERGDAAQGWIQSAPVYYRRGTQSIYYPYLTYGIVRNIQTGARYQLAIPKEKIRSIFRYDGSPMYEEDGLVPVIEVLPSPSGNYVAVVHQVFVRTGSFDGIYLTAVGVFTADGTYKGAVTLTEWNGTDIYLKDLYYPEFPDLNPAPPAFQTYRPVPTHVDTMIVWHEESGSAVFYICNIDHLKNGKATAIKVSINATSLTTETLNSLPNLTANRSTAGGPINSQTKLLMVRAYSGEPNRFTVMLRNL
ncbi:hypothetical protein [Gracilinema caldarium]|uniref:hypothetical protein n=1 Tax=Gracilinema caldarium TaxID=215591 RepID=UPI0026EA831F|nr:hypothetical protein [Gracilinema caldarium]